MNIVLKNKIYLFYILCHYLCIGFGLYFLLAVPVEVYAGKFNLFGTYFAILAAIILGIIGIPYISIKLEINQFEIKLTKWSYSFTKKQVFYKIADIEKIGVKHNVSSRAQLVLFLKNGKNKKVALIQFDLEEGDLENVVLNQTASVDPNLLLAVRLAKTISKNMNIPFDNVYE